MGKIIGILILVLCSAFFSATETAFTSINRIRIKNMANDGDRRAKKVLETWKNYGNLLSTILVGNNLVNIAMTAVATVLFLELYPTHGATVSTVVTTLVVLIFGEVSPKSIAKENPEKFAMAVVDVIRVLVIILTPINFLFSLWKKLLAGIFRMKENAPITEDELITLVEEAETEGGINTEQSELIQNAIEFNDLEAWDVLTPRVDIVSIDLEDSEEDIQKLFLDTGFSRLPVCDGDLDNVMGVLNQKDFHNHVKGNMDMLSANVKPVIFVAGTMKVAQLLKRLQTAKTQIAIIVDEYGGTLGLVTMEDIIEELVGEIYDEHDREKNQEIIQMQDGTYRVLGGTNLEKMFDYFDVNQEINVTTVNGWVCLQLDKIPSVGDKFSYEADHKHFDVKVNKADGKKALEINMVVKELPHEE